LTRHDHVELGVGVALEWFEVADSGVVEDAGQSAEAGGALRECLGDRLGIGDVRHDIGTGGLAIDDDHRRTALAQVRHRRGADARAAAGDDDMNRPGRSPSCSAHDRHRPTGHHSVMKEAASARQNHPTARSDLFR